MAPIDRAGPSERRDRLVLVGLSGSAASLRSAVRAAVLYDAADLVGIVVTDVPTDVDELERRRADVAAALGVAIPVEVRHGSPGPVLCAAAHDMGATALAIGMRSGAALRRITQPVAHHVTAHAPCPVLVAVD